MIDWFALVSVTIATILSACIVVALCALGLRLLAAAGRAIQVPPAGFADAIAVVTPQEAKAYAKHAAKAAAKSPLTIGQRRIAVAAGYACFGLCGLAVLFGICLIVPIFRR